MDKAGRATRAELGLHPRSFVRAVRWQVEDAQYPLHVLRSMSPEARAFLARFNREFHGGRFATSTEGGNVVDLQRARSERSNAKHSAERCIMSNAQPSGSITETSLGTYNPFED